MSQLIYVKGVEGRTVYIPNTKQVIPVDGMVAVVPTVTIIRAIQAGDIVELEPAAEPAKAKSSTKKDSE